MRVARRLATALLAVFAGLALAHPPYAPVTPDTSLTTKQAQRDLRVLERALTELHPGLYRYQSPEAVAAQFAAAREQVADGSTRGEMALIASRIAAAVRCGHTRSGPYNHREDIAAMFAALPVLPFEVRWFGDRVLVTESADASVPRHAELLAIDGRTPGELATTLMPYLRADGGNDAKRRDQLDSGPDGGVLDRLLPLLFPPSDGHYALRLRVDGRTRDVHVRAITSTARAEALKAAGVAAPSQAWSMRIDGDVAVMTLPTFAFWNNPFPWQATLDGWFEELRAKGIRRLVIDLRANEGGDAAIGQALLAQLIRAPYTTPAARVESAYERAPYDLMRFLDTWDYSFFDRTGKVDPGDGRAFVLPGIAPVTVQPVAQPFEGPVVALVGPRMSSGGFLVARDLQASRAATLVGRETGGNLRGLNAGQITWVVLPESGVSVDIPLLATFYDGQPPDRGVRPDIAVANTLEDVVAGRDRELARALRAVR